RPITKDGAEMTTDRKTSSTTAWMFAMTMGAVASVGGCGAEQDDAGVSVRSGALSTSSLLATGSLSTTTDLAPFSYLMENGLSQNVLGGIGSGLAWAGG